MASSPPSRRRLTIVNLRGLHARASAKLVEVAGRFACDIRVRRNGMDVSASSIMGLLMLGAARGEVIDLEADGPDAQAALDALEALVTGGFGEDGDDSTDPDHITT